MSDEDFEKGSKKTSTNSIVKMVIKKEVATTPNSLLIESLVKQLASMIESDDKSALKLYNKICTKLYEMNLIDESYKMTEFEGMRGQYQRALYHLVTTARGGEDSLKIHRMWPSEDVHREWSHYHREFVEMEYIAGGGFGQVFRVRHKLDGSEYAIKKIYIRASSVQSVMSYLAEVKTFASLNHPNVVQYKAAWLELGATPRKKALGSSSSFDRNSSTYPQREEVRVPEESYKDKNYHLNRLFKTDGSSSLEHLQKMKERSSEFTVEFENDSNGRRHSSLASEGCRKRSVTRHSLSEGGRELIQFESKSEAQWATLYIQMSLCQITLKHWLENRDDSALVTLNNAGRENLIEILHQLLLGLQYIHSKGIVHHDIKPSNVFLQMDNGKLCVQLGDFGLACPLQSTKHSLAFGTRQYAAPEQLAGKCDPKSDMFSLGIVLLELAQPFCTEMERAQHVSKLRKGQLPAQLSAREPRLSHYIAQLVAQKPTDRPDATQLLQQLVADCEQRQTDSLWKLLETKEAEIARLRAILKKAGLDCDNT